MSRPRKEIAKKLTEDGAAETGRIKQMEEGYGTYSSVVLETKRQNDEGNTSSRSKPESSVEKPPEQPRQPSVQFMFSQSVGPTEVDCTPAKWCCGLGSLFTGGGLAYTLSAMWVGSKGFKDVGATHYVGHNEIIGAAICACGVCSICVGTYVAYKNSGKFA